MDADTTVERDKRIEKLARSERLYRQALKFYELRDGETSVSANRIKRSLAYVLRDEEALHHKSK